MLEERNNVCFRRNYVEIACIVLCGRDFHANRNDNSEELVVLETVGILIKCFQKRVDSL